MTAEHSELTLYAQPYDISATGFYFTSAEEFEAKAKALTNDYGDPVEEFEIQFIDGDLIDCELAEAMSLSQANFATFFDCVETWDEEEKIIVIIAGKENGGAVDLTIRPDQYDIEICYVETLRELAEQFVDDGLYGEIPERLQYYIDYDAIARDLRVDYTEAEIAGQRLVYRLG